MVVSSAYRNTVAVFTAFGRWLVCKAKDGALWYAVCNFGIVGGYAINSSALFPLRKIIS